MSGELEMQLRGYRLTTAEVLYHMPDHPGLLQSFLWQTYDIAPRYPRLTRFLDFWRREIVAVIHTVRVAHAGLVRPAEWRGADIELRMQ
ncbi:MAG: usg protein [Maricaulaceae bacterium]|nr:usg protein [Maricaulaceae bacterium]